TVTQLVHRNAGSVEQRQQQIRQWRLIRNLDMLPAPEPAHASADHSGWQWEMVMRVAVAHVTAKQNDRMIQHGPVAIGHLREFRQEFREDLRVVDLNLSERYEFGLKVLVMRYRMERIGNTDMRICSIRRFLGHHKGEDSRQICLIRQSNDIE